MAKDYIHRSKERCRSYGLETSQIYSRKFLTDSELEERLYENRELISIAEPFVDQLCNFLKGTSFFSILTDSEGCILKVIGDDDIMQDAYSLKMVPGAFMNERNIGTNAMGTALAEDLPVQVSGNEHYIEQYFRWTCSGAPIHDPHGRVIGALDLTGAIENVHKHTLGMVVAAVNAIEKNLRLNNSNAQLMQSKLFSEKLIDSIDAGILSCGLDGRVLTVNSRVVELLGMDKRGLLSSNVRNLIPSWNEVFQAVMADEEFQNRDVVFNVKANKVYFNLNVYPVSYNDGTVSALIIVVKDIKRVRRHANEIIGRRAVYTFDKMIGRSKAFTEAVSFARQVADSNSTILITGESGTGKEIFAQSIHNESSRRDEAFVVLNCGAIPRTLIESELFGYNEGAFTGAKKGGQAGKFEIADGGTLFLDEIGEMPLDMQVKLLRVLEDRVVSRVGSNNYTPVDVRIIAATNKNLIDEVNDGAFRKDLFYRLNVLPITLPSLRKRREDIPLLIEHYSRKISRKLNKREVKLAGDNLQLLCSYDWPGNIRELENLVELIINYEKVPDSFPLMQGGPCSEIETPKEGHGPEALEAIEKNHIEKVLEENDYNISVSARYLRIGRNTLYRKMKNYGIRYV